MLADSDVAPIDSRHCITFPGGRNSKPVNNCNSHATLIDEAPQQHNEDEVPAQSHLTDRVRRNNLH
jgi:hypothetical protein